MNKATIYFFIENEWPYNFFKMIFTLSIVFIIIYIFQSNPASWWNAVLSVACGIFSSYLFYIYTIAIPTKNNRYEILFMMHSLLTSIEKTINSAQKIERHFLIQKRSPLDKTEKAMFVLLYNENINNMDKYFNTALQVFKTLIYQSPTPCITMFMFFIHNYKNIENFYIKDATNTKHDIVRKISRIKNICEIYKNVIYNTISEFNDHDEILSKIKFMRENMINSQSTSSSFLSRFEV
ncbi:hypothetical protein [uncultured Desulfovibrio sp.]|uniref:hypothetical protein n=1 Tax=uncultured Desulfovibrio sp. TaxID=167968 RepID=UPI002626DC87|nr:hypothetical protein [uncultured Desulfovibrio sp.]